MKPEKVVFIDNDLEAAFNQLDNNDKLKKSLIKAIKDLQEEAFTGRNVRKKLIPKSLIKRYGLNNLWIYNLPSAWRMIYTLSPSEEIEIVAVILDWMDHKEYNKLFGFN